MSAYALSSVSVHTNSSSSLNWCLNRRFRAVYSSYAADLPICMGGKKHFWLGRWLLLHLLLEARLPKVFIGFFFSESCFQHACKTWWLSTYWEDSKEWGPPLRFLHPYELFNNKYCVNELNIFTARYSCTCIPPISRAILRIFYLRSGRGHRCCIGNGSWRIFDSVHSVRIFLALITKN